VFLRCTLLVSETNLNLNNTGIHPSWSGGSGWWWGGGAALPALVQSSVGNVCRSPINILYLNCTHAKISHLVTSLSTGRQQMSSHCLSQVVNKFGTSCEQFVRTLLKLSGLLNKVVPTSPIQSWYSSIVTTLLSSNILVYHGCIRLVRTTLWQVW
jgi:hypothetical protein